MANRLPKGKGTVLLRLDTSTENIDPEGELVYASVMLKAVFPGSFDPPTLGHLNIIERASSLFDELLVVVAENPQKKYLFSVAERVALMRELVRHKHNVTVFIWNSLIVEFMQTRDLRIILRGVRGTDDFSYEFELSMINKALDTTIETIFMTTDPQYFVLRASAVKELAFFQGDVSGMVPPLVGEALKRKYPLQGADPS